MVAFWGFNGAWILSFCAPQFNDKIFSRYSSENLQATRLPLQSITRAVSSVVERLVYTERVGGSKPSPPILHFTFSICD